MADFRAVAAVCSAVKDVLASSYRPEDFDSELEFKTYTAQDFASPMQAGVSLFLYRVVINGNHRTPAPRPGRGRTVLPLDLHFLLTAWGKEASLQHTVAGWMMRVIEDQPTIGGGQLNATWPDVFEPGESIDILPGELSNDDLSNLWDSMIRNTYQLSVPYIARIVSIESLVAEDGGGPVGTRVLGYSQTE